MSRNACLHIWTSLMSDYFIIRAHSSQFSRKQPRDVLVVSGGPFDINRRLTRAQPINPAISRTGVETNRLHLSNCDDNWSNNQLQCRNFSLALQIDTTTTVHSSPLQGHRLHHAMSLTMLAHLGRLHMLGLESTNILNYSSTTA